MEKLSFSHAMPIALDNCSRFDPLLGTILISSGRTYTYKQISIGNCLISIIPGFSPESELLIYFLPSLTDPYRSGLNLYRFDFISGI
jgi:hypothetical protein